MLISGQRTLRCVTAFPLVPAIFHNYTKAKDSFLEGRIMGTSFVGFQFQSFALKFDREVL
jgi:hypothetical protein